MIYAVYDVYMLVPPQRVSSSLYAMKRPTQYSDALGRQRRHVSFALISIHTCVCVYVCVCESSFTHTLLSLLRTHTQYADDVDEGKPTTQYASETPMWREHLLLNLLL